MRLEPFPACCTTAILMDFDGHQFDDPGKRSWESYRQPTSDEIKEFLREEILKERGMYEDLGPVRKLAFITAITSDEQEAAERALREFGFQCTRKVTSKIHDTTTRIWWLRVQEWCEANGIDTDEGEVEEEDEDDFDWEDD